jgi:hypothetical protein
MSHPYAKNNYNTQSSRSERRRTLRASLTKGLGKQSQYFYKLVSKRRAKKRRLKDASR